MKLRSEEHTLGDVLDSGGTFTFDLSSRGFDFKAANCVTLYWSSLEHSSSASTFLFHLNVDYLLLILVCLRHCEFEEPKETKSSIKKQC